MAPAAVEGWMQQHLGVFGSRKLSQLCIPASHDAGCYKLRFGTVGGREGPVLTQTKSILEQLQLGVRRFDIRPTFTMNSSEEKARARERDESWQCGHYTAEAANHVGWQGGSCALLSEVIADINQFTKNHAELIIVDISHIYALVMGTIGASEEHFEEPEWDRLLRILSGINHLFTMSRVSGDTGKHLQNYQLKDFIGSGQSAVIVVIDTDQHREKIMQHGFWPKRTPSRDDYLTLDGESVTHMQGTSEAILSLISSNTSVLKLAADEQAKRFPWLLQDVAAKDSGTSVVWMDRIENADLITFCLAISFQRYYQDIGKKDPVIVYGGQLVQSSKAQTGVQNAIGQGAAIAASNDLLSDTWNGMVKSCAVFYQSGSQTKGRWAKENQPLHFELDVASVNYGGKEFLNKGLYVRMIKLIAERGSIRVTNGEIAGGSDPQFGVRKTCIVRYRGMNERDLREQKVLEFDKIQF